MLVKCTNAWILGSHVKTDLCFYGCYTSLFGYDPHPNSWYPRYFKGKVPPNKPFPPPIFLYLFVVLEPHLPVFRITPGMV